jgi:hypothetical protein
MEYLRFHLTLNYALRTVEIDGRELDDKDPWGLFFDDHHLAGWTTCSKSYVLVTTSLVIK